MHLLAIQTNLEKECVRGTNEPDKALQFQKVKKRVSSIKLECGHLNETDGRTDRNTDALTY